MPVFTRRINEKINRAAQSKRVENLVNKRATSIVESAKDKFMGDINSDPSSVRVESNSETIGYFGFNPDDQPVDNLKFSIDSKIAVNPRPRKDKVEKGVSFKYSIKYPSRNEIYNDPTLNLPWISQTWVEKLERGIGNIEQFLFFPSKGRSEFGIQGKPSKSGRTSGRTETPDSDYLDRLRGKFSDRLNEGGLNTKR